MQTIISVTIAGLLLLATCSSGFAGWRSGGGVPGCQQAVTNIPSGTTDSACAGGPPGPSGWPGFVGGPDMRISAQGHKNWPNYPDHGWPPRSLATGR
jgi:hypothetical protein